MAHSKQCLRCGGTLIEGFIVDQAQGGAATVPSWVEGAPERSVWTGVKLGGKSQLDVASWRCRSCGLLENYAPGASGYHDAQKRIHHKVLIAVIAVALLAVAVTLVAALALA